MRFHTFIERTILWMKQKVLSGLANNLSRCHVNSSYAPLVRAILQQTLRTMVREMFANHEVAKEEEGLLDSL